MSQTPRAAGPAGPDAGPARGRHSAASRQQRAWPLFLSLVLVATAVAGGLALHQSRSSGPDSSQAASNGASGTPGVDLAARSAGVDKVLAARAHAVQAGNEPEFLADVDPGNKALLAKQRMLYENLRQFGFAKLGYEQIREQFDQSLVDKYGPSTYAVAVAMAYQIEGIDPIPVRTVLGYTFTRRPNGRWMLVSDTDLDLLLPRGSHQEAWDIGRVLVKRGPRVLVVVEQNQGALATSLVAKAVSAVKAVSKSWPGGWHGAGFVISLDDKVVRGADYSLPKNAEDALAMATWVYRTLPGEATGTGERADSYVVINPRNRTKVDARTLAHEFTHVATAPYGAYVPRWIVEGAATYIEFLPMDGAMDLALDKYRTKVRTKYLAKAKNLPADSTFFNNASSSYPLSWLALDYLFHKYGGTEVATLYQEMAALGTTQAERNRIMTEHLGITEAGLFQALRADAGL
ncbi:hypothetical protein F1D05_36905 [Kribbella qitaiheensis]|uniref:Peptidase MA-like domain-containing protein n=1 Tax=Kribbella qitaiheensis TaxID=1544730 RepID=A0A7G6X8A0_9ACTN|nr:hypothetical protein [Kribbella qitaiheensis]QNE22465.1 hypothetical protein F1D05_36905 [Kribbella qitaiheensis]